MFTRHPKAAHQPATGPHPFLEPPDPRLGLALAGSARGGATLGMAGPAAIAMYSNELDRCAAPGCGQPRDNPIHWPPEGEDWSLGSEPVK